MWCHSIDGVFFHEIECNGMTSFMEFKGGVIREGAAMAGDCLGTAQDGLGRSGTAWDGLGLRKG